MDTSRLPIPRRRLLIGALAAAASPTALLAAPDRFAGSPWRKLTDAQWKSRLSPAAFDVLRRDGTEHAWTSPLLNEHRNGVFACVACGLPLFRSQWKFESGTGWPSFYTVIQGATATRVDFLLITPRTEYHCARCLGHQGHVFHDGPRPTGLRYCNDGVALKFIPA